MGRSVAGAAVAARRAPGGVAAFAGGGAGQRRAAGRRGAVWRLADRDRPGRRGDRRAAWIGGDGRRRHAAPRPFRAARGARDRAGIARRSGATARRRRACRNGIVAAGRSDGRCAAAERRGVGAARPRDGRLSGRVGTGRSSLRSHWLPAAAGRRRYGHGRALPDRASHSGRRRSIRPRRGRSLAPAACRGR